MHLGLSIPDTSNIAVYEYWYDHVKPKYGDKAKLCYTYTDSFIIHVETEDIYAEFTEHVNAKFDTPDYEVDKPLPIGKKQSSWSIEG